VSEPAASPAVRRIDLRGGSRHPAVLRGVLPRAELDVEAASDLVRPICESVRRHGGPAVLDATRRLDGVELDRTRVPAGLLDEALATLDPAVRRALEEATRRTRLVHEAQARRAETISLGPGATVTEKWLPVRRVGLYVPGGQVAYPSSVVMNVVPAQVAGVRSLAVTSPPQKDNDGLPHPAVLAACALLGVEEVHAVGGAQAVAMLAYGTDECAPVDLVTGPGNVFVAAAKRLLRGVVGIDAEAGPTEIGILADETADPVYVAADLIAQAEHDEHASCLLVTPSEQLLDDVDAALAERVAVTRHRARVQAALRRQSAYALVDDLEHGLVVVDEWAAEHLEVLTEDARRWADRVVNAGAVFVGPWAPVSLGDYLAGSNHVLPTGGTARHTGGLSVQSFLRSQHVVDYSRDALAEVAPLIDALGGAEDLGAHVDAVRVRIPVTSDT
jgi:histidinol dehydrogenase